MWQVFEMYSFVLHVTKEEDYQRWYNQDNIIIIIPEEFS